MGAASRTGTSRTDCGRTAEPVLAMTEPESPAAHVEAQPDRTAEVRDPYARWCGRGGVVRRPPIPIIGTQPKVGSTARAGPQLGVELSRAVTAGRDGGSSALDPFRFWNARTRCNATARLSSPALVCCTGTDGATLLRVYGLSRFNSAVACADQFFEQVRAATFSAFAASSRSPRRMLDSPIKKYASQRSPWAIA